MKAITIFLILFSNIHLNSQITWQHEILAEASSPSQIFEYPNKSQIYRLGYQSRFKTKYLDFGISILPEFNQFKMTTIVLAIPDGEMTVNSFGARLGFFLGKKISRYFSTDIFFEYGEYSSDLTVIIKGLKEVQGISAIRSHSIGAKFKYLWQEKWHLYIKIAYESYRNSSTTIFQTTPNHGRLYYNAYNINQTFVNGFVPSLGVQYHF